ncbi:MAG: hypothetical protein AAB601_01625 [Patescibacteria group bacterium]
MNFKPTELQLINRVGVHYTAALRFLALLPETRSPKECRRLFERARLHLAFMGNEVRRFRSLHANANVAPAVRLLGAARFKGALEFVKGGALNAFEYAIALADGTRLENLIGPLPPEEEREQKQSNKPLVRGLCKESYRLFSPEKPISRFYAQQLQTSAARLRKKDDREREEKRQAGEAGRLPDSFISPTALLKKVPGKIVFRFPGHRGERILLALSSDGHEVKVVRATGSFADLEGESFRFGLLPPKLFAALKRQEEKENRTKKDQKEGTGGKTGSGKEAPRKANILPLKMGNG